MVAVAHANLVLSWQENMMEGEMPPAWMWHLDHELVLWFERVEEKRKTRFGGDEGGREDDLDAADMMTNDLAKGRR